MLDFMTSYRCSMGHFRVAVNLTMKARLSARLSPFFVAVVQNDYSIRTT